MRRALPLILLVFIGSLAFGGVGNVPGVMLADEGTNAGQVTRLDCVGTGVACTRSGVTGTVTISGGGASPLTTKGDLYTFTTVDARLGVGADNLCLIADSTQATGLKWGSCSAGGGLTFGEVQRLVFMAQ